MEEIDHFKRGIHSFTSMLYSGTHFKTCIGVNDSLTQSISAHKCVNTGLYSPQGFLTPESTILQDTYMLKILICQRSMNLISLLIDKIKLMNKRKLSVG